MKQFTPPVVGEKITSVMTKHTYTMGKVIGTGNFSVVFACTDDWGNEHAAKVLKPKGSYEQIRQAAQTEFQKLVQLRHPCITYIADAFEFRDTFYIITERCHSSLKALFSLQDFNGLNWLMPIAKCLLQAVHFLHWNNYAHQDIHSDNIFTTFIQDEVVPAGPTATKFKLGDLGIAKLHHELNATNTRAAWMLPPETLQEGEFGRVDYRGDIYHLGLLFLQIAYSKELQFTREEVLRGRPREMAEALPEPYRTALSKALRRHVKDRTGSVLELWRDLKMKPAQISNIGTFPKMLGGMQKSEHF